MERRIRVLLYEDKLKNAILISQKLKNDKYKISDIVSNYEDAVNSAQNNSPQLILLENHFQKEKKVNRIIKFFQNKLNIPVICLLDEQSSTRELNSCGALKTPLNINKLDHLVNSVLNYEDIIEELSNVNQIIKEKSKTNPDANSTQNPLNNILIDDSIKSLVNSQENIDYIKEKQVPTKTKNQIQLEKQLDNIFFAFLEQNDLRGNIVTFEENELFLKDETWNKKELPEIFSSPDRTSIDCCHILKEAYESNSPVISKLCHLNIVQYCLPKYNKYGQLTKFYIMQNKTTENSYNETNRNECSAELNEEYNYIKQKGEQFYNFIQDNL